MTTLSFTRLFCPSSSSHFYRWLFPESSHRPANTLSAAPPGMRFSHIRSPLFYLLSFLFLTVSICLLWNWLSLSLALHLCHLSISLLLSLCETYASPSQSCNRPLFYSQTPSYSIPPAPVSLYPSLAFPHLAGSYSWECAKKAEKIKKNKLVTAAPVDKTLRLTWNTPFSFSSISFLSPPLSLSLYFVLAFLFLTLSPFFQFTIFCSISFPIPCHLFKGRERHPAMSSVPARIGSGEGDLGKVVSVARASETCQQSSFSQTDDEWRWVSCSMWFYVGRGQPGTICIIHIFEIILKNFNLYTMHLTLHYCCPFPCAYHSFLIDLQSYSAREGLQALFFPLFF